MFSLFIVNYSIQDLVFKSFYILFTVTVENEELINSLKVKTISLAFNARLGTCGALVMFIKSRKFYQKLKVLICCLYFELHKASAITKEH